VREGRRDEDNTTAHDDLGRVGHGKPPTRMYT
jgi:hypothetical protein